jgi:predicted RNA binding protein YcfA (HicA-like mRNA interferase family)
VRDVIRLIQRDGWKLVRIRGSHLHLAHPSKAGLITIPGRPGDELAPGRTEAMKYLVVVEETGTGYSAYSPDLAGCAATGANRKEVEASMREAIEFHLEGLEAEGDRVPVPRSYSTYVDIPD